MYIDYNNRCKKINYSRAIVFRIISTCGHYSIEMPSVFGCLSGLYFQCCEQWFCFDKSIALYSTNDTISSTCAKQNDTANVPYFWNEDPKKVVTTEPKSDPSLKPETHLKANNNPITALSSEKEETEEKLDENYKSSVVNNSYEDHRSEIPVIRQQNVPKFYLGSPEVNDCDLNTTRSQTSSSIDDTVPPYQNAFHFDLKTIADMDLEPIAINRNKNHENNRSFSKLLNFKDKFKPFSSHKQTGSKSMPNFAIHSYHS